jgi:ketosteroid isomerase-like protein
MRQFNYAVILGEAKDSAGHSERSEESPKRAFLIGISNVQSFSPRSKMTLLPAGIQEVSLSPNQNTIEQYIDGFNQSDHAKILACLTDDVEWLMPGTFHLTGKAAFDREIENEAFTGRPTVTITRMIEQNDIVVAEGRVRAAWKKGGFLNAVFCDVFEMENASIRRLISYLVALPDADSAGNSWAGFPGADASSAETRG